MEEQVDAEMQHLERLDEDGLEDLKRKRMGEISIFTLVIKKYAGLHT